jgi:hypothetical protein
MPTLTLVADVLGRPLALLIAISLAVALLGLLWLQAATLLGLDPAGLDDLGSWRWMPDA